MITKEEIAACRKYCKRLSYNVGYDDISYLILNREFRDKFLAYSLVKGKNVAPSKVEAYDASDKISILRQYMNENWTHLMGSGGSNVEVEDIVSDITFEDNRDALIKYLSDIQRLMQERRIDPKDGVKMMTDIRMKLNDKFNIKEQQVEQRIIVQPKFSHICQHTHKECWLQTEQFAMEHWHLIKDPNWKGDE